VSESKSVSASSVSPASVIFKRSVASRQSSPSEKATSVNVRLAPTEGEMAKRSSGVASAFKRQLRQLASPITATSQGRPHSPKSVIKTALLKARRAARAELFDSIASRLAALKVPSISQLRPVALRQRPRFLS
jgi:hypothetical protein